MDKFEARTVQSLLRLLGEKEPIPRRMIQTKISLFLGAFIFIIAASLFADHDRAGGGYVLLFLSGALTGAGIYQSVANRQWLILRKHLNRQSLESSSKDS
jgi:hypothetical protein